MLTGRGILIVLVIFVSVSLTANSAFPNGINPPRPADSFVVTAICKNRTNNIQAEIFRAKVKIDDLSAKELDIRIGNKTEKIALSEIKSITSISSSIGSDGFAKATMVRTGKTEETNVRLQVSLGGLKVKLVGFDKSGKKESVNLSDCKSVDFSSSNTGHGGNEENRPAVKK